MEKLSELGFSPWRTSPVVGMPSTSGGLLKPTASGDGASSIGRLREATGRVVGSVFYATMLKTMREGGFEGRFGHGGRGEKAFAPQLHNLLAERMGTSQSGGLAEALFKRLEAQQRRLDQSRAMEVAE